MCCAWHAHQRITHGQTSLTVVLRRQASYQDGNNIRVGNDMMESACSGEANTRQTGIAS